MLTYPIHLTHTMSAIQHSLPFNYLLREREREREGERERENQELGLFYFRFFDEVNFFQGLRSTR